MMTKISYLKIITKRDHSLLQLKLLLTFEFETIPRKNNNIDTMRRLSVKNSFCVLTGMYIFLIIYTSINGAFSSFNIY